MTPLAHVTRRGFLAGTVSAAAIALAACGEQGGRAGRAGAVRIDGAFGPTELPGPPRRVVALGFGKDADAAIALGVVPVAVPRPGSLADGLEPWTARALGGARPALIDVNAELSVERVAALRPDLILATGLYSLERYHDQLARVAPVLAYVSGPNSDGWEQTTLRIGRALGREARARRLLAEVDGRLRRARAAHPELVGARFTFSAVAEGSGVVTKNSSRDVLVSVLGQLGLRLAPQVERLRSLGTAGLASVGGERLDLLDADLTLVSYVSAAQRRAFESEPVFERLAAVKRGGYVPLDMAETHALAFPSALAIGYMLDEIVPRLAAARAR